MSGGQELLRPTMVAAAGNGALTFDPRSDVRALFFWVLRERKQ